MWPLILDKLVEGVISNTFALFFIYLMKDNKLILSLASF